MDDMQRYRDIKANADPEDPADALRRNLTVAFDQGLAEAIRLERQGKHGKVRALGFTATADLLGEMAPKAPATRLYCCTTAFLSLGDRHDEGCLERFAEPRPRP